MLEVKEFKWHESDCWTMVCTFYERWAGVKLPVYVYGQKETFPPDEAYKHWSRVAEDTIIAGDLIIFHMRGLMHVGVVLNDKEFLHTIDIGHLPLRVSPIKPYQGRILGFARLKVDHS
jgi:cell wall-associated NlpC family hydrolase